MKNHTRLARIERFAAKIQQRIVSCPNEQSFDDGDTIWIFGCPTSLRDLVMDANVPETLKDEVIALLGCPRCDSSFVSWQDVGTKYPFEAHHESLLASAADEFYEQLIDFRDFLKIHQGLGATHVVGRRILREIRSFPKSILQEKAWFRACSIRDETDPTTDRMRAPNPRLHRIRGGRFNYAEQSHWYLTSSPVSAVAEISANDERSAWVQEWCVPQLSEVLDLRAYEAEEDRAFDQDGEPREYPLIAVALIFGDLLYHAQERSVESHPEYLVPRFLADAAKRNGYVGIYYRSPRHSCENLVLFDSSLSAKPIGALREVTLEDKAVKERELLYIDRGFPILLSTANEIPDIDLAIGKQS